MVKRPRHYGWLVSPYSAKTRSYLRFSGLDFEDVVPTPDPETEGFTGGRAPPYADHRLDGGRWLQDSCDYRPL